MPYNRKLLFSIFLSNSLCIKSLSKPFPFYSIQFQFCKFLQPLIKKPLTKRQRKHFVFRFMASSNSVAISPRKLRSDLYSYSYQEDSNTPLVISVLSSLIERTLARNERISRSYGGYGKTRVFDCREIPDMTIQSYLERIFRYTKAGPSVYVVAYVYIDRFCQNNQGFRISLTNVHRLLITTIMVASKYVEDM